MARSARRTNTWWSMKRVEHGLTIKDVASKVGIKKSTCGNYFTGHSVPSPEVANAICKMLNVDVNVGRDHFYEAHKQYVADKHGTVKESKGQRSDAGQTHQTRVIRTHLVSATAKQENALSVIVGKMLGIIYGKVDYTAFLKFVKTLDEFAVDPLTYVYGAIPYSEFFKVAEYLTQYRTVKRKGSNS